MKITTDQLLPHLNRDLKGLYTVFGDETLLALEATDRIRAKARAEGYTEREVLTVESGFKWSQLAMAGSSQSLFCSRKLLELRVPTGKPGTEGSASLQQYCGALPADTITLIYLPAIDWRAQKAGWFEALERAGVLVEARAVARKALPQWITQRLQEQKQSADDDTLSFIADRVEGNLMAAHQEVQKLALLFPPGALTFDQVRGAVLDVARYDIFSLGEVVLTGDPVRYARMLDGLKGEGSAPPLILWALSEEIRAIGRVLTCMAEGKQAGAIMRDAKVWGQAHQNLMQHNVHRFSLPQVNEALRHAAYIDRAIKGVARADVWDQLLQLGLRFAVGNDGLRGGQRGRGPTVQARALAQNGLF
jgi:DNA polymerase III subunit delta